MAIKVSHVKSICISEVSSEGFRLARFDLDIHSYYGLDFAPSNVPCLDLGLFERILFDSNWVGVDASDACGLHLLQE